MCNRLFPIMWNYKKKDALVFIFPVSSDLYALTKGYMVQRRTVSHREQL